MSIRTPFSSIAQTAIVFEGISEVGEYSGCVGAGKVETFSGTTTPSHAKGSLVRPSS